MPVLYNAVVGVVVVEDADERSKDGCNPFIVDTIGIV
jgi:hypothetical protein